jgi:hypothetical protein
MSDIFSAKLLATVEREDFQQTANCIFFQRNLLPQSTFWRADGRIKKATERHRVARLTLLQHTKTVKMYQNDHKIYQMAITYGSKIDQINTIFSNIFHCKTLQNLPKLGFLFENIPCGNPGEAGSDYFVESIALSDPRSTSRGHFFENRTSGKNCLFLVWQQSAYLDRSSAAMGF